VLTIVPPYLGATSTFEAIYLPDKTTVQAKRKPSGLFVTVSGTPHSIADCGEQLAWLSAALRHGELHECAESSICNTATAVPSVQKLDLDDPSPPPRLGPGESSTSFIDPPKHEDEARSAPRDGRLRFHIHVQPDPEGQQAYLDPAFLGLLNLCVFPAVVQGFALPGRSESCLGVEMSTAVVLKALQASGARLSIHESLILPPPGAPLTLAGQVSNTFSWRLTTGVSDPAHCVDVLITFTSMMLILDSTLRPSSFPISGLVDTSCASAIKSGPLTRRQMLISRWRVCLY